MTGYRRPRFRLTFDDSHPLAGLVITLKSMSMAQMLHLGQMAELDPSAELGAEDIEQMRDLFNVIVANTVEWNLEHDDGTPVAIGSAAWDEIDFVFVMGVAREWMEAVAGVAAPLAESVNSGGTSPAVPIPMELPSSAPLSFMRP